MDNAKGCDRSPFALTGTLYELINFNRMKQMIRVLAVIFFLIVSSASFTQERIKYLKKMHARGYLQWYKTMTFTQATEFYRNDSLIRKATWYEAFKMPYDLRIDLEDPGKGIFVLYKKDSLYRFQGNVFKNATPGGNPLSFFLGAMYLVNFDSVRAEFSRKKFDINKGYKTKWNGRKAYVIGRNKDTDTGNAIWIDLENLWIVRIIQKDKDHLIDAHLKDHTRFSKGWSETAIDIYVDGKLFQKERYSNLKTDVPLDDKLFDTFNFVSAKHWYN